MAKRKNRKELAQQALELHSAIAEAMLPPGDITKITKEESEEIQKIMKQFDDIYLTLTKHMFNLTRIIVGSL